MSRRLEAMSIRKIGTKVAHPRWEPAEIQNTTKSVNRKKTKDSSLHTQSSPNESSMVHVFQISGKDINVLGTSYGVGPDKGI